MPGNFGGLFKNIFFIAGLMNFNRIIYLKDLAEAATESLKRFGASRIGLSLSIAKRRAVEYEQSS